jgi:hypothetical protein
MIVETARALRVFVRGKPQPVRDATWNIMFYLKAIAVAGTRLSFVPRSARTSNGWEGSE